MPVGAAKFPAATICAEVMVVSGSLRALRLSHASAACAQRGAKIKTKTRRKRSFTVSRQQAETLAFLFTGHSPFGKSDWLAMLTHATRGLQ
jgi:hypothetical protein